MKTLKFVMFVFAAILFVQLAAAEIEVEKVDLGSTVVAELGNPAVFNFSIINHGAGDEFEIYTLVGVTMTPKWRFDLPSGKSEMEVLAFPSADIRKNNKDLLTFEYQIKGRESGIFKDNLMIKIVELKDVLGFEFGALNPEDDEASVKIKNKENTRIEKLEIDFSSEFFDVKKVVSLSPHEEIELKLPLSERDPKLVAGPYLTKTVVRYSGGKTTFEGDVDFLEKEGISVQQNTEGFIVRNTKVKKTNVGNTEVIAKVELKKGIVSRFFTLNSPSPTETIRESFSVTYLWDKPLLPGESFDVESKTNYTIPFLLLILIVAAGLVAKFYSFKAVVVQKNVSFVRAKGGEFALKVKVKVTAKGHVDNVQLIDSLPAMTHLYEKFGKEPDKFDKSSRRLFWNLGSLDSGEERVYSYIIYSKINIVGRFELPVATVVFSKDGKTEEVWSNRAFFAKESSGE